MYGCFGLECACVGLLCGSSGLVYARVGFLWEEPSASGKRKASGWHNALGRNTRDFYCIVLRRLKGWHMPNDQNLCLRSPYGKVEHSDQADCLILRHGQVIGEEVQRLFG